MKIKQPKLLSLVILTILLSCSCTRTIYTPIETTNYHTDTIKQTSVRIDTIVERDSVSLIQRGDTVFFTKYRDRFRYRDRVDTVYKSRSDTLITREPYPVEKELSKLEKAEIGIGKIAIGLVVIGLSVLIVRLINKTKKQI